jgi:ArsR family transcriptional regulator
MASFEDDVESAFRALASDRRLLILEWLKTPPGAFSPAGRRRPCQGRVCGVLIAEKLGVSQPTVSEHLKILSQAGLVSAKRVKQWTFYKRDESAHREAESGHARQDLMSVRGRVCARPLPIPSSTSSPPPRRSCASSRRWRY